MLPSATSTPCENRGRGRGTRSPRAWSIRSTWSNANPPRVTITAADLETIRRVDTDSARYFHRNSLAWCRYWVQEFPSDSGFHPWDSAAIAWLRHPEYFTHDQRGWQIRAVDRKTDWLECDSSFAGDKVTYCTGFAPGGAEAFVADVVSTVF